MKLNFPRNLSPTRRDVYLSPAEVVQEDICKRLTKDRKVIRVHRGMDAKVAKSQEQDRKRAKAGRWYSGRKTK